MCSSNSSAALATLNLQLQSMNFILKALIACSTLCLSILLVLSLCWRSKRTAQLHNVEPQYCYMDEGSVIGENKASWLKELIIKNDKNTKEKNNCDKVSAMLERSVKKIIGEKYNSDTNPEYVSLSLKQFNCTYSNREEAQLHLKQITSHAKPVPGKATKVFWKSGVSSGNGIQHLQTEGAIYVRKSGKYYISSQLTTRAENDTVIDETDQTINHVLNIISYNEGCERILLEHVKSMCEMAVGHAGWTSHIGAVFHLEEHDRIYVATSRPYNLVSGPGSNHFSIHKI
ncbi:uncharacterized protein LOC123554709 isoform X2 [Mercenaria mercenaria]|uniref:uncharacterized protein LOC123554709 isoform X2 n=1 Tax=Mercenaria mercenaria TaxID=6596 RepID=UPI00234F7E81|nr:uncharacterized protein LOC123554709 isoform X2 [Mercenaria mercenaria]XP_053403831.1 uncharacterized protein LOC123554709 isoform X2 [Mercenaria mercenaria]XP_053403832.1 uncharacterized protein LOC123554709 isoform X2 [Mercenaria mercenaria]